MRTGRINADELQFCVGLPIQRYVKVARKNLPFRAVVQFDKMTFGVRFNFHTGQRREATRVPAQTSFEFLIRELLQLP